MEVRDAPEPPPVHRAASGPYECCAQNCGAGRLSSPGRLGGLRGQLSVPAGDSCFPGEMSEGLGGPEFLLKLGQDKDGLGILIR